MKTLCIALLFFALAFLPAWSSAAPAIHKAAWVEINYDELIERDTLTHSGKTIGGIFDGLARGHKGGAGGEMYANLQPYLEPFSFVLNDVVSASRAADQTPYVNLLADYPAGARQPAWAALFREGHYQLFYGGGRARLFLKGDDPAKLLAKYHGVVRHPLREVLEKTGLPKLPVEVYAFQNDYGARTLRLNLAPAVTEVTLANLAPRKKALPLADLAKFFEGAIDPEGAEIDGGGEFFLYGSPSPRRTVAGAPLALEDFAVVYRSVFHNGVNPPYISLDPNEDNRFAKVNFGGLLEDTRVGSVVLEADKIFKTIGTGLDANSHMLAIDEIRQAVPDFATEDERAMRLRDEGGTSRIRYWFYPDKLRSVTDGQMAAVENYQFTANAERQDIRTKLGQPQRETIDHLNDNANLYARAFKPLAELQTVGRLMVLVNWLHSAKAAKDLDLDALLSVELSPVATPRRTKKMLAVTIGALRPSADGKTVAVQVQPLALDDRLEAMNPTDSDVTYITLANQHVQGLRDDSLLPKDMRDARAARRKEKERLEAMTDQVVKWRSELEGAAEKVNPGDQQAVLHHNERVEKYNALSNELHAAIAAYNEAPQKSVTFNVLRQDIVSVAGGISLRPSEFPKPLEAPKSKLLQRFRESRNIVRSSPGREPAPDLRVAAKAHASAPHAMPMPVPMPTPDRPAKGAPPLPHPTVSTAQIAAPEVAEAPPAKEVAAPAVVTSQANPATGASQYSVKKEGYYSETTVKPGGKEVLIKTTAYPSGIVLTGNFAPGGTLKLRKEK